MSQFTKCSVHFCICPKNYTKKASEFFLQTRIMVDGAKFNSYDSGSHFKKSTFKNGYWKKKSYIFVTDNDWVEVASKIEHAVTTYVHTSYGIQISTFLNKIWGWSWSCPVPLSYGSKQSKTVLIKNSRTAWPTWILMLLTLDNLLTDA